MQQSLSPRQLARAIGVSESSLKRWADEGRLSVHRTVGGHRRIPIQEAIRFSRDGGFPILRPDVLGLPDLNAARAERDGRSQVDASGNALDSASDLGDYLFQKLRAERADEVCAILIDAYLSGQSVAGLIDGPIREAVYRIGRLWREHANGIFLEHRAIDILIQSLQFIRAMIRPPSVENLDEAEGPTDGVAGDVAAVMEGDKAEATDRTNADDHAGASNGHALRHGLDNGNGNGHSHGNGNGHGSVHGNGRGRATGPLPVAVGGAVQGDPYILPSLAAACVMAESGYREINLGPDLPVRSLLEAAKYYRPRVLWVSVSIQADARLLDDLHNLATEAANEGARTVVGGRGLEGVPRLNGRRFQYCSTMSEMAAFARGLSAREA